MFYFLSKTAFYFLMPFTWVLVLIGYALFTNKKSHKKNALIICIVIILFFSNDYIINRVITWWEPDPIEYAKINKVYDVGIVLTGITIQKTPKDRVFFHKGADRATHALQLYRLGIIKKILITGGRPGVIEYGDAEADLLAAFFLMAGVPERDIIIEHKAKNTFENAQNTAIVLKAMPELKQLLLITSAFHMPRASECFSKAGLVFDTFPVDYYSHDSTWSDLIPKPDIKAFQLWSLIIHEWIGYLTYKIVGKA